MSSDILSLALGAPPVEAPPWPDGDGYEPDPRPTTRKTSWTLAELLRADFPEPRWAVPGLLPVGLAHLGGRPKLGKSWLALQLAVAVGSGGRFLDREVEQGHVLYIALEDSPRRLQDRLRKLGATESEAVRFETDWPQLDLGDERIGYSELCGYVRAYKPRLIVIDTLARAFSGKVDWNDVGATTAILGSLQRLAQETETCILCLDHHRKNAGTLADLVDDILGSTGKSAVVDTIWGFYRKRGERGATLRVTGRDLDDAELALEFDGATFCWQLLGDAREMGRTEAQAEVLEVLRQFGEDGADAASVAAATDKTRQAARKVLEALVDDGKALRRGVSVAGGGKRILYVVASHIGV